MTAIAAGLTTIFNALAVASALETSAKSFTCRAATCHNRAIAVCVNITWDWILLLHFV